MITCPDPIDVECGSPIPVTVATATDICDPSVDVTYSDGPEMGSCPGLIVRTFTATDDCGNTAQCTQHINIIDTTPPVVTIANGLVASAAIKIFCSGEPGRRLSLPNARFMIHQPSTYARGQASDIDITAKEIVKLRERYFGLVAEVTGRSLEQVTDDCKRDFWLSPEEAVEYKLVDRIVTRRAEVD